VAVNPEDSRYKQYIGQEFKIDFGAKEPLKIKIIADKNIDMNLELGPWGSHQHIAILIMKYIREIRKLA
jgi:hypothetical protein